VRVKRAVTGAKKKRAILKQAKGFRGQSSISFRIARQAVMKAGMYAYIGRRLKKRDMRSLWIARINAACRMNDTTYSRFMDALKKANITIDRKVLAEIAYDAPENFAMLVKQVTK